ncbi:MAG: hypothetical protein HN964_03435 [Candidatus Jacksonbacteria bacterium]|nr:hypothetical protein [Candidatus Jacksonbacteria bacterium]
MSNRHWDPIPGDEKTFRAEARYLGWVDFQWNQFLLGLFLWWGMYVKLPHIAELLPLLLGSWMPLVFAGGVLWRNPKGGFLCAAAPSAVLCAVIVAFKYPGNLIHLLWFVSGSGILGIAGIQLGTRIRRGRAKSIQGNTQLVIFDHEIEELGSLGEKLRQIDRTVDLRRLKTETPLLYRRVRVPSTSTTT